MPRSSSRAKDAGFSSLKQGFKSPTGCHLIVGCRASLSVGDWRDVESLIVTLKVAFH